MKLMTIHNNLQEGLEHGDLKRLVHNEMHIDEFKSKLGDDKDVIVVTLKVASKGPAEDLVGFIEKGYDWVLDGDLSPGEMEDGSYVVFIELARDKDAPKNIIQFIEDLENLTDISLDEWRVRYYKGREETTLSLEALESMVPTSPEAYEKRFGQELDQLKTAAGVKVTTKAPKNEFTETLRNLAGIIR